MKRLLISVLVFALWLTLAVPTAVALKNTYDLLNGKDVTLFADLIPMDDDSMEFDPVLLDEMGQFTDLYKQHVIDYYEFNDYKDERDKVSYYDRVINQSINMLKDFEGFSKTTYKCVAGRRTIGYGHTGKWSYKHAITKTKAEQLLRKDVKWTYDLVKKNVEVELDDTQYAVLISFAYNVGQTAFRNSTLLKKLNDGDYEGVDDEIKRWVYATRHGKKIKSKGLIKRRLAEAEMWNSTLNA